MDDADRASALAEQEVERNLAVIPRFSGESATECEECGNEIPAARRDALKGTTQCVECATALENQQRMRA